MINYQPKYLDKDAKNASIESVIGEIGFFFFCISVLINFVIEHIEHIKKVTGSSDWIGIGSDFDSINESAAEK